MHNQLEKYISKIEDQLATLPAKQRGEELREIRSHLEMMIEENIARGCDSDEAVTKALEQFGSALIIGHDLKNSPANEAKRKHTLLVRFYALGTLFFVMNLILFWLKTSGFISSDFPRSSFTDYSIIALMFVYGWNAECLGFAPKEVFRKSILAFITVCGIAILFSFVFHDTSGNLTTIMIPTGMFAGMCISRLLRYLIGDNSNARKA